MMISAQPDTSAVWVPRALRKAALLLFVTSVLASCGDETHALTTRGDSGSSHLTDAARPRNNAAAMDASTNDAAVIEASTGDAAEDSSQRDDPPEFRAHLKGDQVWIAVHASRPLYYLTCTDSFPLEKRFDDGWIALTDERPTYSGLYDGYYLGDVFVPPVDGLSCDVVGCFELGTDVPVGRAVEYVQIGTRAPPPSLSYLFAENTGDVPEVIPVLEARAVHGPLRARLRYTTTEDGCDDLNELTVEFEVPEDGVCCPIGADGCLSDGPTGGWAPDSDSCDSWFIRSGEHVVRVQDARGCPTLLWDPVTCCDCEDAGM